MSARDDKVQGINVHVKNARTNISCAVSKVKDAMIEIDFEFIYQLLFLKKLKISLCLLGSNIPLYHVLLPIKDLK